MFGVNGIYNGYTEIVQVRGSHQSLCHLKVGWGCRGSGLDSGFLFIFVGGAIPTTL